MEASDLENSANDDHRDDYKPKKEKRKRRRREIDMVRIDIYLHERSASDITSSTCLNYNLTKFKIHCSCGLCKL